MKCSYCQQDQKLGEIFQNGMHWSCGFFERAFQIIQKNSWRKVPEKLLEDVIDSPTKQAEKILGGDNA